LVKATLDIPVFIVLAQFILESFKALLLSFVVRCIYWSTPWSRKKIIILMIFGRIASSSWRTVTPRICVHKSFTRISVNSRRSGIYPLPSHRFD
jgi:hypothetical protein